MRYIAAALVGVLLLWPRIPQASHQLPTPTPRIEPVTPRSTLPPLRTPTPEPAPAFVLFVPVVDGHHCDAVMPGTQ